MASYARLFSSLIIGSCTIKNRIVSSGHDTVMVNHGEVSDQPDCLPTGPRRGRGGTHHRPSRRRARKRALHLAHLDGN